MQLTYEQIKSITWGADRVEEIDGYFRFFRFTEEQEQAYMERNSGTYAKLVAASSIKLIFRTNSTKLAVHGNMENLSTRKFYSLDVFCEGMHVGSVDNFSNIDLPENYTEAVLPDGKMNGEFSLGSGYKTVTVYLPWNNLFRLSSIELDDCADITPIDPECKMLVFGDSITQGYDTLRPSNHHIVRLGELLSAEIKNKAIGGEYFWPHLVKESEEGEFDYILVAYGTNDWSHKSKREVLSNCRGFYSELSAKYPKSKIFALGPIWRADHDAQNPYGDTFANLIFDIKACVRGLNNVVFIDCIDFVPHDKKYFSDLYLHPNDEGFEHYFINLYSAIKEYIG